MTLGKNIQSHRKSLRLSQEKLAEQIGVSRQAVAKWEADQSSPSTANLTALASLFGVSMDELSGLKEEEAITEKRKRVPAGRIYCGFLLILFLLFLASVLLGVQLVADAALTFFNLFLLAGAGYVVVLAVKALRKYVRNER